MKIVNETRVSTRQLRKLVTMVGDRELWSADYRKHLVVRVKQRRHFAGCAGRAPYGTPEQPAWRMTLFVRPGDPAKWIADTIAHEAAHNHGVRHRRMPTFDTSYVPEGFQLPWREPAKRVRPGDDGKLARAQANLERARTRAKRAQTFVRKYQRQVVYYERKLAAKLTAAPVITTD